MPSSDTNESSLLKAVFDLLPSMIFVVDRELHIREYNAAAADLLLTERETVLRRRAGDILHCIHAVETRQECGTTPFCQDCVIRNAVTAACDGDRTVRRRKRLELVRNEEKLLLYALITATPFTFSNQPLALLVIEDISDIAELQRLVPICTGCMKVRDDRETWMRLEAYFKESWDLDFTHGFCPDCLSKELARIDAFETIDSGAPPP